MAFSKGALEDEDACIAFCEALGIYATYTQDLKVVVEGGICDTPLDVLQQINFILENLGVKP